MALKRKRVYPGEPSGFLPKIVWHFHRKRKKLARNFILRLLRSVASTADIGRVKHLFLLWALRNSPGLKDMPLVSHAAIAKRSLTLAPETVSVTQPPCEPGKQPQTVNSLVPAIMAHVFHAADAAADSTAIVSDGRIGVPEYYINHAGAIISDPNHLLWHSRDGLGIVNRTEVTQQPSGIMLFAHGATNWYHWLIENLPAAYLTQGLPDGLCDLPLVIPAEISGIATFRDSLELFRNGREVVALGPGVQHFKCLVMVDSLVREPMNLRSAMWPVVGDYGYNRDVMRRYRAAILDRLDIGAPVPDKRIFLARGNSRRVYNQAELVAIAERHGFSVVCPEDLSFREQVELLAQAAVVIGPSGAAFTNTLFCQPGTRLLSWLPPQYRNFCSYTNIASTTESRLRYLITTPERPLRSTFDAYVTGYHVDSHAFETALRCALESPEY